MRIFRTRSFSRWASKARCSDSSLAGAANELVSGLHDGNLGGSLYKKRVAIDGRGKSGGTRVIVVFSQADRIFFVYGYAKSERATIGPSEEAALKLLARELLGYTETGLVKAVEAGILVEIQDP